MKKKILLASILVSFWVLMEPAGAVVSGFYGGGGLGVSRLDLKDRSLFDHTSWNTVQQSMQRGGLGWKLFVGYNLNEFLGVEIGYTAYANSKFSGTASTHHRQLVASRKNTMNALNLVAKIHLPIGETGFNVYALGGGAQTNGRVISLVDGSSITAEQKRFRPMYGAGVGYIFTEQFSANLELSRIQGDAHPSVVSFPNADALTLSLAYHLG